MESLKGEVKRVTFRNLENGYSVLKVVPQDKDAAETITVVGILPGLETGDQVEFHGSWGIHQKFGRQFNADSFQLTLPTSLEGLKTYLVSHIKGLGPVLAEKIIGQFQDKTAEVLENTPEKLSKIPGITKKKAAEIGKEWQKNQAIRDQLIRLSGLGITPKLSLKIINTYEYQAYQTIKENPYRLAEDIWGVGFIKADEIATKLGFQPDHPQRVSAGVKFVLGKALENGHLFLPKNSVVAETSKLIDVPAQLVTPVITQLISTGELVLDQDEALYLKRYHEAETDLAKMIAKHQDAAGKKSTKLDQLHRIDLEKAFAWIREKHQLTLHPDQKRAVQTALNHPLSILTGGPGTGKSTTLKALVSILKAKKVKVALCAPTGRAAKRMTEITAAEAKTIHRTLKIDRNGFARYNKANPLHIDFLIVDEVSMLDALLAQKLFAAIGPKTHLLLVGDNNQLPSVQAGNVLADLIQSGTIPTVQLTKIFRQAQASAIVRNAHRINQGYFPEFPNHPTDFYFFNEPDAESAANLIVDLVTSRIPQQFNVKPLTDIQVLAPMHKTACGVTVLNQRLQEALNPKSATGAEVTYGQRIFRLNDRVLQTSNNYEKEVFNGEIGKITAIDRGDGEVRIQVKIDSRMVVYRGDELDQLTHAYAISCHKSQGSEYPVVVIPILTSHYIMLARNLLYTAITRAKDLVILVGSKQAIWMAINNNKATKRNTLLATRLQALL